MTINIDNVGPKLVLGVGVALTAIGTFDIYKSHKLLKKFGIAMENIEEKTDIQVEKEVIDKAVNNLVDKKYKETVKEMTEEITNNKLKDIDTQIHDEVKKVVDEQKEEIKPKVNEAFKKKIDKLDIDDIKTDVLMDIKDESRRYLRSRINGMTSRNFMGLL